MSLLVPPSTVTKLHQQRHFGEVEQGANIPEERVGEDDVVEVPALGIIKDVAVNEEQQRHVDLLSREQLLLFKAKAFDLGEVWRNLRTHRVNTRPFGEHYTQALTLSGVTLYVAMPMMSLSDLFFAL